MNPFLDIRTVGRRSIPLALAALLLSSCSLMHDDLPECATRPATRAAVSFIYDYNTDEEDLFATEVGSVTLYVYDADNRLVTTAERTAADGIRNGSLTIPLELPYGTYHLYASARASEEGYEAAMLTPGAKFRRTAVTAGDPLESLIYTLDNNNGLVEHGGLPLEEMWLTREPAVLTLTEAPMPAEGDPQPEDVIVTATVPLQRVTNTLHIRVSRDNSPDANLPALSAGDYEVWAETRTGRHALTLTAQPTPDARTLRYTPHAAGPAGTARPAAAPNKAAAKQADNTVPRAHARGEAAEAAKAEAAPAIEYAISTSRLIREEEPAKRTQLFIRSRLSGETFSFDLNEQILAQAREAYAAKGWTPQEYLDRQHEHNFEIRFKESDEGWRYIEVSIPILNWAKRIQNVEL